MIEIAKLLFELFVNRKDVYAQQFLNSNNKKGFKTIREEITLNLIEEHLNDINFLGIYQLNEKNEVKWACLDFDKNTQEDFDDAIKLYRCFIKEGFHPLIEKSGGGNFKVHIWLFFKELTLAYDVKNFLNNFYKKYNIFPHETFPKQSQIVDLGNLVKLPLGKHLESNNKSTIFSIDIKEAITKDDIIKTLKYHFDNRDICPIIKLTKENFTPITIRDVNRWDAVFKKILNTELPAGSSLEIKKYKNISGVNDNILKNLAIYLFKNNYTIEKLEAEIKPIYIEKGWNFSWLKGWFEKAERGEIKEINPGELYEYFSMYKPEILSYFPPSEIDSFLNILNEIEITSKNYLLTNKIEILQKIQEIEDNLLIAKIFSLLSYKTGVKSKSWEIELEKLNMIHRDPPISIMELLGLDIQPPEYWIKPIIPKNAVIVFAGKPESFKSLFVLISMLYAKSNKPILNFEIHDTPKVLYYDLENGPKTQYWRTKYAINGGELDCSALDNFKFIFTFNTNDLKGELELAKDYDIIVLDSFVRFLNGPENKSEIVAKFYNDFLYKLKNMGKTVIVIHHFRKGNFETYSGQEVLDALRGSGDLGAQPEVVLGVFKTDEELVIDSSKNCTKFNVRIIKAKGRDIYPIKDFAFEVLRNDISKATTLREIEFLRVSNVKERRKHAIVEFIRSRQEAARVSIINYVNSKEYRCDVMTIARDLKELLLEGKIKQDNHGVYKV